MVRNWQNADWICTRIFRKCGDDEILNISGTLRRTARRRLANEFDETSHFFPTQPIHASGLYGLLVLL